jgi:hypothetical protein
VHQGTGFTVKVYNQFLGVGFFKGGNDCLINVSANIGKKLDVSSVVQSVVFTYRRVDHLLSLFCNGVCWLQNTPLQQVW